MIKKFPNTATGAVVGSVMGMLISSIPILGWALGWLIAPLFIALGLAVGFWSDIQFKALRESILSDAEDLFNPFKNVKTAH